MPSSHHRQPPPICRKPRRHPFLAHRPQLHRLRRARTGQLQRPTPIAPVQLVHGQHQVGSVFGHGVVKVQCQLFAGGRLQVHQHHDCFGVFDAGFVKAFDDGVGRLGDVGAVAGGAGQGDAGAAAVLRVLLPEGAGADEGHDLAGVAALFAQFFCGAAGVFGNGFLQLDQLGYQAAKAPGQIQTAMR